MDEQLMKERTLAKRKFTRKVNLLKEAQGRDDRLEVLRGIYDDVCKQFLEIEKINEQLAESLDTKKSNYDVLINELDTYITDIERTKIQAHAIIAKVTKKDKASVNEMHKVRMQRLTPPHFDGKIRDYPTFCKDYERLMKSVYEDDPYVLRSCLSGEALEVVHGVDDSFDSMMKRLDARYGNPARLVQSVLNDIKTLKPIPEDNPRKFMDMVSIVERASLDLEKVNLSEEMNTVTMVSHIEKLLPPMQKREWTKILQTLKDKSKMFEELLKYLLKEKQALEYMNDDIRATNPNSKVHVHSVNLDSETDVFTTAITQLHGKQSKMEECLVHLSKQISMLTGNMSGVESQRPVECWYHGTDTHDITQCTVFQKLNSKEKIDAVYRMGACFLCLQLGHRGRRQCSQKSLCGECGRGHHQILHNCFGKEQGYINSSLSPKRGVLLIISSVYGNTRPITTLWDSGSNTSLITDRMAKFMGLKGRSINLAVTKVGNDYHKFETLEYDVPLNDFQGQTHVIKACGISEITSETGQVDMGSVAHLLGVQAKNIERPYGKIDLLIAADYCKLFPSVVKTVGNLQLLWGPFGYCIRGSHPRLKVKGVDSAHVLVRINHIAACTVNDLVVESKASVTRRLDDFFSVENLGTCCIPKCGNCKCGKCPLGSNKYSLKEGRELSVITQDLIHDSKTSQWTASYPWIKSPKTLPNNFTACMGRLRATEKRLAKRGVAYAKEYSDQISDMVERGVARKLTTDEIKDYQGPVHYIPHHEILRPDSKSTPIRIVFNSSASYMGHVLNDYYAKGPDMLCDLFGILLRFRQSPVAIVGDISKMYNSVLLSEADKMTHRFLWRDMNTTREPDHYCLQTVTFGDRPSGVIAMTALHKTAEMFKDKYPETAAMIINNSYVDDILHSCESAEEALERMKTTEEILKRGGFQMKQWVMSGSHDMTEDSKIIATEVEKVLGMIWEPKKDQFSYKVKINFSTKRKKFRTASDLTVEEIVQKIPKQQKKRMILSQVASLYDPSGLATPFTIRCKLLMRHLITRKQECKADEQLGWDEPIPDEMHVQWVDLFQDMYALEDLKFRRCIKPDNALGNPTLVIYTDASNIAYSTCAYIRFELKDGTFSAQLLAAKSRIAPIRQITTPRLSFVQQYCLLGYGR
ncbi:uncharacterized protein [Panulirus ornatus]|uniref:uncharacterized protein n=1 Tax=Panulirus ornatus TaxID=150431 RepID=UPI003A8398EE